MNDTDVFHTPRRLRARRWFAAWRSVAQLGMLLDGRAHTWAGEPAGKDSEIRKRPADCQPAEAPRLARLAA